MEQHQHVVHVPFRRTSSAGALGGSTSSIRSASRESLSVVQSSATGLFRSLQLVFWNDLPQHVTSTPSLVFRSSLKKTYLLRRCSPRFHSSFAVPASLSDIRCFYLIHDTDTHHAITASHFTSSAVDHRGLTLRYQHNILGRPTPCNIALP